jgi:hypothetical protein
MGERKIFISYSRRNNDYVDRVISDLSEAGFDLWRDFDSLKPGTPSWERAIREAVKQAEAVVLIASPSSLASDYVQGELALAKIYHRPIYPIWAEGTQWIECVPLDMVNHQYVDGRNGNYSQAIKDLISTMGKLFDQSEGSIKLGLPTHEIVELNLAQFDTAFNILSHVWLNYLQDWYEVLSYGREWIIGNVDTKQIALPWEWLKLDVNDPNAIMKLNALSGSMSYSEFGIQSGSYWAVWDARRMKATGVFLNDDVLSRSILSVNGPSELRLQLEQGVLKQQSLDKVVPSFFKYRHVIAALDRSYDRGAIVEV